MEKKRVLEEFDNNMLGGRCPNFHRIVFLHFLEVNANHDGLRPDTRCS